MQLPALYHWSPRDRRKQITRRGLAPGCRPTIGTISAVGGADDTGDGRHMICLATDPVTAWALSGAMPWARDLAMTWDLWQARLERADEVHVLPNWGPRITEVRVANRIPKSRVTWLAERSAG
jgi:hypothetical protein